MSSKAKLGVWSDRTGTEVPSEGADLRIGGALQSTKEKRKRASENNVQSSIWRIASR